MTRGALLLAAALGSLAVMGAGGIALLGTAHAGKPAVEPRVQALGTVAPLPAMEFTLADGHRMRQVELRVLLEFDPTVDRKTVEQHAPRIANALSASMIDVNPVELTGSAGTRLVKEQVSIVVNREMKPIRIRQVLLQRFLVR
ncbi:MAG TPA: flagellar basal body-associated FliL family protein [Azospirillum sp.]